MRFVSSTTFNSGAFLSFSDMHVTSPDKLRFKSLSRKFIAKSVLGRVSKMDHHSLFLPEFFSNKYWSFFEDQL